MKVKRIIPCLDVKDGRVVKGVQFLALQDAGDPVQLARAYEEEGADELVFLDISASSEGRATTLEVVKRVAESIAIPLTVGGGIHSLQDMERLFQAGVTKVSLNSAAVRQPELLTQGAQRFGSQQIVLAVDAKYDPALQSWRVYTHGGSRASDWEVISWVQHGVGLGAGEILLTSMDQDGVKNGYDVVLTKAVSEAVSVPVIASGGAGSKEDFKQVFKETEATGALAASIFHFKEITIKEVKTFLQRNGVTVR